MSKREKMLIDRCKNGDIYAFEELIENHQKKVYNIAFRMVGNEQDAYDIVQEVFIKVFKSINKFKGDSAFSTWLYRITTNVCIDEIRKRKKAKLISLDAPLSIQGDEVKLEIPDNKAQESFEEAERKEVREEIIKAINELNESHKAIIILRDINGYSYDEIANILECSLGTVKSRINRARGALKKIIVQKKELLIEFNV
jgi:RNA polymerase sigma-70 factor (ECF subfamily)